MSAAQRGWRHVTQRPKRHGLYHCGRKRGYQSAANAESDRLRLIDRQGKADTLQVYHHGKCKGYHVGYVAQERQY
jgi:hypothetical protein